MKFLDFLIEAETINKEKSKAIKHLTHLGGEAQFVGRAETNRDLTRLEDLHKHLSGEKSSVENVGVKADGSPSFEMGHVKNPATGEKEFGVAYKGAARGYAFTPDQVKEKFGHSPGLASKMGQLLEHGKKVMSPIHGVVQGDFMGSQKDKTITTEGNKISHKENLIKYSYPKESEEGKQLKKSKISISLHTRIDKEQPEYNIDTSKFYNSPDVHMFNNKLSRSGVNYSQEDKNEFDKNFSKANEHLKYLKNHDELVGKHTEHLQTYINKTVREGTTPTTAGYKSHLKTRLQKDVDKVSRPANKLKKSIAMKNMISHVEENKGDFDSLFKAHVHLDKAKNVLLRTLENSNHNQEHTINGKATNPEGFVVGYKDGSVSKVVNRSKEGFSGQNLNK
jgi:hypothetical protein